MSTIEHPITSVFYQQPSMNYVPLVLDFHKELTYYKNSAGFYQLELVQPVEYIPDTNIQFERLSDIFNGYETDGKTELSRYDTLYTHFYVKNINLRFTPMIEQSRYITYPDIPTKILDDQQEFTPTAEYILNHEPKTALRIDRDTLIKFRKPTPVPDLSPIWSPIAAAMTDMSELWQAVALTIISNPFLISGITLDYIPAFKLEARVEIYLNNFNNQLPGVVLEAGPQTKRKYSKRA